MSTKGSPKKPQKVKKYPKKMHRMGLRWKGMVKENSDGYFFNFRLKEAPKSPNRTQKEKK